MASFGYGFGTGLMGGMSENIKEDRQNRLLEAQLMGDVLGLQGDLPSGEGGAMPTTTEPRSGLTGLLGAIGLGGNRTGRIEQLIQQRQMLARKAAAQKQAEDRYTALRKMALDSDFGPEEWSAWQARVTQTTPQFAPYATGFQKKVERERKQRAALSQMIGTGKVTVPGREDAELGMSVPSTTREATQQDLMGAAAGVKGLEDDAFKAAMAGPKVPPRPVVVNTPAGGRSSILNPLTGATERTIEGPPRPTPTVDPVVTESRRILMELRRKQIAGTLTPKEEVAMLTTQIRLNQSLKEKADPGDAEKYDAAIRRDWSLLNQAKGKLRGGPAAPGAPAPTQPGGGGLPPGLPPESKQIGTKNGKPVYESPDGKRYVVE